MKQLLKKVFLGPVDWLVYTVLNEQQRKAIGDIFSDDQKEKLKKIVTGKKQAERQRLKQIKYHLYNLGFIKKGLLDLKKYYQSAKDPQLKRLAAWELTLWYANQNTVEGSAEALIYIESVKLGEQDIHQLRRIAIVEAECLDEIGDNTKAKATIEAVMSKQTHVDLYFAAANLEPTIDTRLLMINKGMELYNLAPISFGNKREAATYDDLKTENINKEITDGPKVSIILPAYNAEEGVRIAIESILGQTWKNIELLAVDDCSPDNTARVIQEYVKRDSRVVLLSTPENSGPYIARNIALKEATGEYITINDADDWSHAEKIEKQVKHLMGNESVIANTSSHARLTEELKLYRRGTPGKYTFPNMSSIMFRKDPILEKVGFWDSVRFAADGEFKRRLIQVFGKNSYVDLDSGPLSLPRQTVTSLTGSSAFGYNGFFMGVRKEYVESLASYHKVTKDLYYPYPMERRPYQVPEPMWPTREIKQEGKRYFDIVLVADFRVISEVQVKDIQELYRNTTKRIGLIQLNQYGVNPSKGMNHSLRELLDGDRLQNVVYGEKVTTDKVVLLQMSGLEFYQRYIPQVETNALEVVIEQLPKNMHLSFKPFIDHLKHYFQMEGKWYPKTATIQDNLQANFQKQLKDIPFQPIVWEKSWMYDE